MRYRPDLRLGGPDSLDEVLALESRGLGAVKLRIIEHPPYRLERKTQLTVEQDLLQSLEVGLTVQTVTSGVALRRHQETHGVVVVKRALRLRNSAVRWPIQA